MTTNWKSSATSAAEAVSIVKSGDNIFIHGAAATPTPLIEALSARTDLEDVKIYHLHTNGPAPFAAPDKVGQFRSISLFTGQPLRQAVSENRADFIPIFLSDIPQLFTSGRIQIDVALLQLSLPDAHGLSSLGTSCDAAKAAGETAKVVVAEFNEQMPRTLGANIMRPNRIHRWIHTDRPLLEHPAPLETEVEARIGQHIADLVEDGSTLQVGIGGIAGAALTRLTDKLELGVHTEMFSDQILDLVDCGAITNRQKVVAPGRLVTSFIGGTQRLFDFVRDNPLVNFHPCNWTNDVGIIGRNPKVVAINSALQIDLSGQVCADSIGHRIFSGIGGQMDFIRGAARSPGGKPIIALPSRAMGGKVSRIVSELNPGAGVVTTRGHVHWVVTEFGVVNLHGKTLRERSEALISIAHPDFRAELARDIQRIRHFPPPPPLD
jgi:acyl-CoA hydrolase